MGEIVLPHNWLPRAYQKPLWKYLRSGGNRAVLKWHRRSGKDDIFLHHTAYAAHQRVGNYWYMLPEAKQARKSMWTAINPHTGKRRIDEAFPKELIASSRDDEMMLTFHNGSTSQLVGSDNFDSLVGSPPIGLVFSEYAISNPAAWSYLMPILEENGGWAGFNSTPRGKNHFKTMCEFAEKEEGWFYSSLNADETGVFSADQLLRILRQLQSQYGDEYGEALFRQEYYVSFDLALPGAIWGDCLMIMEKDGRIGDVPYIPGIPVFTGWDLGYDDDTTCWYYQMVGDQMHVIDYHESRFRDIASECIELDNKREKYGYEYGIHWLPHDARPRTKAAGGRSMLDQASTWALDHGNKIGKFAIAPRLDVQEGIQAARATFPICRFDAVKCGKGLDHLKAYRRKYDTEKDTYSSEPEHDRSSHAADGWRSVAVTWRRSKASMPEMGFQQKLIAGNVIGMNFGQLKNEHLRRMRALRNG